MGLEAEENSSEHQPSYSVGETLSEFSLVSEDQLVKIISGGGECSIIHSPPAFKKKKKN